jgi:lipoprotein-anchoring transpeptidase ErfK/SrfK
MRNETKSWMVKGLMTAALAATMTLGAAAQGTPVGTTSKPTQPVQTVAAQTAPVRVIVVSLEDRKLALIENGEVKKIYSVAVGKPSTPSPQGRFTIERRVANPVYHHNGRTVEPGPGNPVGTRWMGLNVNGYGIHGTNEPKSIGKAASHGCIRMGKADLEEFYALVAVGDQVQIIGERNEETARLFNPIAPVVPMQTAQVAQTAKAEPKADPRTEIEATVVALVEAGSR